MKKKKLKFFDMHSIYEGELKNELPHGYGKLRSVRGIYYEGNFKKGKLEGDGTYYNVDLNFNNNHTVIKKSKKYGSTPGSRGYITENVIIVGSFKSNIIDGLAYVLNGGCFHELKFHNGYLHGDCKTIGFFASKFTKGLNHLIEINVYNKAIEDAYLSSAKTDELNLYTKNKKQLLKNKKHYKKIITSLVNKYNWFPSAVHKNKKEYLKKLEKWVLHSKN